MFLGVDVAGGTNAWVAAAMPTADGGAGVVTEPRTMTLTEICGLSERWNMVAVAIDAQLTMSVTNDTGFRPSDLQLRELLPSFD